MWKQRSFSFNYKRSDELKTELNEKYPGTFSVLTLMHPEVTQDPETFSRKLLLKTSKKNNELSNLLSTHISIDSLRRGKLNCNVDILDEIADDTCDGSGRFEIELLNRYKATDRVSKILQRVKTTDAAVRILTNVRVGSLLIVYDHLKHFDFTREQKSYIVSRGRLISTFGKEVILPQDVSNIKSRYASKIMVDNKSITPDMWFSFLIKNNLMNHESGQWYPHVPWTEFNNTQLGILLSYRVGVERVINGTYDINKLSPLDIVDIVSRNKTLVDFVDCQGLTKHAALAIISITNIVPKNFNTIPLSEKDIVSFALSSPDSFLNNKEHFYVR